VDSKEREERGGGGQTKAITNKMKGKRTGWTRIWRNDLLLLFLLPCFLFGKSTSFLTLRIIASSIRMGIEPAYPTVIRVQLTMRVAPMKMTSKRRGGRRKGGRRKGKKEQKDNSEEKIRAKAGGR